MKQIFIILTGLFFSLNLFAQSDIEKMFQRKFILAEDGQTIELPKGNYYLEGSL